MLFFIEFCVLFSFKLITIVLLAVGVCRYMRARSWRKKNNRLAVRGYHLSQKVLCLVICLFQIGGSTIIFQVFIVYLFKSDGNLSDTYVMVAFSVSIVSTFITMGLILGIYNR